MGNLVLHDSKWDSHNIQMISIYSGDPSEYLLSAELSKFQKIFLFSIVLEQYIFPNSKL